MESIINILKEKLLNLDNKNFKIDLYGSYATGLCLP